MGQKVFLTPSFTTQPQGLTVHPTPALAGRGGLPRGTLGGISANSFTPEGGPEKRCLGQGLWASGSIAGDSGRQSGGDEKRGRGLGGSPLLQETSRGRTGAGAGKRGPAAVTRHGHSCCHIPHQAAGQHPERGISESPRAVFRATMSPDK